MNRCRELKKDPTWKPSPFQKILFYFQLIPRLQQINEIFGTETEGNRMVRIIFNRDFLDVFCLEMDENIQ